MVVECPECGRSFKGLGYHLAKAGCDYPTLTEEQEQIIQGLMLGDGSINHHNVKQNGKPFLTVKMTNHIFLAWLKEKLQPHSLNICKAQGSQKSVKQPYVIRTIRSPEIGQFAEWYGDDGLRLKEIEPSRLALKIWFVSDGYKHEHGTDRCPTITIATRFVHADKSYFANLLESVGVDKYTMSDTHIHLRVDSSLKFWEYIGMPIPGFEHKWPKANKLIRLSTDGTTVLGGNIRREQTITEKDMNAIHDWLARLQKQQSKKTVQQRRTDTPDEQETLV